MSIYDYSFQSIEGKTVSLSDFQGKVMLIVNTASKCGFTPQYEGLEKLYEAYKDQGLVVIGFPCNQFAEQEPGTNSEVQEFCKIRYGVTFPLTEKVNVRDENADPIFQYLTENTTFKGLGKGLKNKALELMLKQKYGKQFSDNSVKWNFTKFLIGRDGKIAGRFEPTVSPESMVSSIEECL
ncbi:glutathione peroxidase [Desulfosporosinus meridiei]|uniref:Glutathione peroxidase n=1 Tax=Desulfosporosinus meridiei (strain ATCC BAA-275 / DSM 13257 / KCTC 12902 / NCIMB 13706 / S10) TaxID=768704 RepID=J7IVF5_DESMD|nr:glutathione peroxidase [Desulfosporosinus meridiei]AFQ42696.1 glutathione peroxidase [Desulfosporosinus meridiei DSM 13257]